MLGSRLGVKTQNNGHNARYPVSYIVHLFPVGLAATSYMHKHTRTHTHAQGSITNNSGVVTRASAYAYNTRTHTHGKLITAAKNDAKTTHAQTSKTVKTRK